MQSLLIICGVVGALIGGCILLFAIGVWKQIRRLRRQRAILERLASLWVTYRSRSGSIGDAEAMIYREFGIPINAPDPVEFFRDLRKTGDRSNPLMFEWMVLRETAYNILCFFKIYPRPRGQDGGMTMGDEMNQSSAFIALCHPLRQAISKAEKSGMTPPDVLKELETKGLDITINLMTGKPPLAEMLPLTKGPKLSSAVAKATPHAKSPLPGMTTDAEMLAKKPLFTVLMCDDHISDAAELMIKSDWSQKYTLRFIRFKRATELLKLAQEQTFDLIFLYVGNVDWDMVAHNPFTKAAEVLGHLKSQYGKPIIATQGMDLRKEFEGTGVTFLVAPYSSEEFSNVFDAMLTAQIEGKP